MEKPADIASAYEYIEILKKQLSEKDTELLKKNNAIEVLKQANAELDARLKVALFRRFGKSSEKTNDKNQPSLFNFENGSDNPEEEKEEPEKESEQETVQSYTRRKSGRKPLSKELPRVEKIIDLSEEEKKCACGQEMKCIGFESSEKLVVKEPEIYVLVTKRLKYACHTCEGSGDEGHKAVRTAPCPPQLLPKSIAGPELLAFIFTNKFNLHLPYYRQAVHFKELGAAISRQNMSSWQEMVGNKIKPLLELYKEELKKGPVMHMDETRIQVLHEVKKDGSACNGYMWAATGGRKKKHILMYEYHPGRSGYYADSYLDGYKGYLQTDSYGGYTNVEEKHPGVIHAGCFAHARRRFYEASKTNPHDLFLKESLKYIEALYGIEKRLKKQNPDPFSFVEKRKEACRNVLERFKKHLETARLLPPLADKAVSYTLNQWPLLIKYLESADLTPDNNECENAIRPFVVGRKNWLFSGSTEGAESSCALYSLIETAKRNGLEPYSYLLHIFTQVPLLQSEKDWESLLPWTVSM